MFQILIVEFYACFTRRLKTERRAAATARQDKEEHLQKETRLVSDLEASKRREDAHRKQTAALKREITELRQAFSHSREHEEHDSAVWQSQQQIAQRVAFQRDAALQEVGALAQELESLQVSLTSPVARGPFSRAHIEIPA